MDVPQKIKNRTTKWSNSSTPGYISEGKQIIMLKACLYLHVHCGNIYIAKTWKHPKCPSTDKWIKEVWYIHTTELYSATKKKEILPFVTMWVDLDSIRQSELIPTKTNIIRYHFTCRITKQYKWTFLQNRNRFTEVENKFMVSEEGE